MKSYKYVFGPVASRRFGRSLGVDLTPCKTCCLDCVFCQLGRTTVKTLSRAEYVPIQEVIEEIEDWLKSGGSADCITLSGSGEPTLHSRFEEVIDLVHRELDIPAVLLTNGTTLCFPEVRDAARRADIVKVSLSAWDQSSFERINRPCPGLRFEQVVEGQKAFRSDFPGKLRMEVFVLAGINSKPEDMKKIAALARQIRPDRIELNTAVRPPADQSAIAVPREEMEKLARLFDPPAEIIGEVRTERVEGLADQGNILAVLKRHPCTAEQIASASGAHVDDVLKTLAVLTRTGKVRAETRDGNTYYLPRL